MTRAELRADLTSSRILDHQLQITDGQNCSIVKAKQFITGDEIIYIPDLELNGITLLLGTPLEDEDIEQILNCCYTGNDFVTECGGDIEKAERLFWYCDWQHPSSVHNEGAVDDDDGDGKVVTGRKSGVKDEYLVLCYPTQALGMIVDLGSGPATENGDRTSQYFTIAKGRKHIDRKVSVALIENINSLAEGERYYTLHMIDDVNGRPCELYHTADLSEASLVTLLKEILDNLEKAGQL